MKITLFYNQYTNGGAVDHECWETFDASEREIEYGSCYSLCRAEIDAPEGWHVAEVCGKSELVDETGHVVIIDNKRSDTEKIYVCDGKTLYARRLT
jgi:hypothetical protein